MDTDILLEDKDYFYGDDILDQLVKDYGWSSLLDVADASPSEILADAVPVLLPPTPPGLSYKSSLTESSGTDSGSDEDSKNSSSSAEGFIQSPYSSNSSPDSPSSILSLQDIEQFLTKSVTNVCQPVKHVERNGPVMAIENGVIKCVKVETDYDQMTDPLSPTIKNNHPGNCTTNPYFKVINENITSNTNVPNGNNNNNVNLKTQLQVIIDQKKVPAILRRPISNIVVKTQPSVIPADSTKIAKIAIPHLPIHNTKDTFQMKMSPPRSNIVISPKPVINSISTVPVKTEEPTTPNIDISNLNDAQLKAIKKQQRMIKNRESACQSRQKKKDYVSALEQQLLEAHQEIARLQLENKLLRDQVQTGGRSRKIARMDSSVFIPKKNIAVLFAMVFMVSLNWNFIGWNSKPFDGPKHVNSRHLLWEPDNSEDTSAEADLDVSQSAFTNCKNVTNDSESLNQTECIRIAGELNRWIGEGTTLNWTYNVSKRKRSVFDSNEKHNGGFMDTYKLFNKLNIDNFDEFHAFKTLRNMKERSRLRRLKKSRDIDFSDNSLYDYEGLYRKNLRKSVDNLNIDDFGEWNTFLQALQRRDDTFYVVGVGKGKHLLLPAVSHNVTKPPKMALILPARSGNESLISDHVTLMQIDCSVVNTTLVKLKPEALPESLRRKPIDNKSTTFNSSNIRPQNKYVNTNLTHGKNNINTYPMKYDKQMSKDAEKSLFGDIDDRVQKVQKQNRNKTVKQNRNRG